MRAPFVGDPRDRERERVGGPPQAGGRVGQGVSARTKSLLLWAAASSLPPAKSWGGLTGEERAGLL